MGGQGGGREEEGWEGRREGGRVGGQEREGGREGEFEGIYLCDILL